MAKKEQNNILNELSKLVQKKEKINKKIVIALTEREDKAIRSIATSLNTTVSEVVKNTLKIQGIFDNTNNDTKGE